MGCYKKDDDDKGQCGVIGRVFFYILGFIGIAFSLLTVFSCKFLSYTTIQGTVPATLPSPFTLSETANVGLFRWDNRDEQVENTGCVYYTNDQIVDFDSAFRTAQIVGYVAVLCAGLALLLSTIEFVCCRFCCSIFFLSFLMISGMVTQALTFAIFTTDNMCTAGRSCTMQDGSIFSITAACCYFVASIIVCSTPKPTPWIKRVKDEDDDTGCLACCVKKLPAENVEEVAEKTAMPIQDSPEEVAAAVAAGAAAGAAAGTAVVMAAEDEEAEDNDKVNGDEDPEAAEGGDAQSDEETGDAVGSGDDSAVEAASEVPSVAQSELSQAGEEITLEASQSFRHGD